MDAETRRSTDLSARKEPGIEIYPVATFTLGNRRPRMKPNRCVPWRTFWMSTVKTTFRNRRSTNLPNYKMKMAGWSWFKGFTSSTFMTENVLEAMARLVTLNITSHPEEGEKDADQRHYNSWINKYRNHTNT